MTAAARAVRLSRPAGSVPTMAVVGDVDAAPLRAAGWLVRARLAATPWADPRDAPGYVDVGELLADTRVDAVAVDGEDRELAALLPELRRAGLLVLLPTPAPRDPELLRAAHAVDGPDVVVALSERWSPWARTVTAALPLAGGPPLQVTVRSWPRGAAAAAELVNLVTGWCGEVASVAAVTADLPARELPGGEPVVWSLLTASGATVLVAHGDDGEPSRSDGDRSGSAGEPSGSGDGLPLLRVSFSGSRLEAGPGGVRWVGGDELSLLPPPSWLPLSHGNSAGLVAAAATLTTALGGAEMVCGSTAGATEPADLGDLLVAVRVLEALRASARSGQPERVA